MPTKTATKVGSTSGMTTGSEAQTTNGVLTDTSIPPGGAATVNKKKQKRRQKEALKAAAVKQNLDPDSSSSNLGHIGRPSDLSNGHLANYQMSHTHGQYNPNSNQAANMQYESPNFIADSYDQHPSEDYAYSDQDDLQDLDQNYQRTAQGIGRPARKKRSRNASTTIRGGDGRGTVLSNPTQDLRPYARQPTISSEALRTVQRKMQNSIWDTNSTKERADIKQFWVGLTELERKKLVNIEKSHVLQKMKEQQKHSCSCTVCGRKRTAIEEELELLLQDPRIWADPTTGPNSEHILSTERPFSSSHTSTRQIPGRIEDLTSEDDEGEEGESIADDRSEEEDDDEDARYSEYSDDEDYAEAGQGSLNAHPASEFFQFGNSLTVKDGILTVADDLLKNDGQKFIDMMEQLAERRMAREEDARTGHAPLPPQTGVPSQSHAHAHAGEMHPDNGDYFEEEDDEEDDSYDSQDDYAEEEEDEIDALTEDQRMEEGRRMFQIFAARMFEQRVVHAYKEKVAEDRQRALIEAEENTGANGASEAKKAKAAEKKKRQREKAREVKAQKEAAKEEERKRKEAVAKEAEEKRKEEQRLKQEEARKRKDAEREALLEKKRRKEAETQKRLDAERERQQDNERKQREHKAEEKRKREELEKKKREEKESREKLAREKKIAEEEQQRNKREKKENQPITSREAYPVAAIPRVESGSDSLPLEAIKRPSVPAVVALPPSLQSRTSQNESPQAKVATPALPKPPTPARQRETPTQQLSTPQTPERTSQTKNSASPAGSNSSQPIQPPGLPAPSSRTAIQSQVFSQQPPQASTMRSMQPPPGVQHPGLAGMAGILPMGGYNISANNNQAQLQRPGMMQPNSLVQPIAVYPPGHTIAGPQQRGFMPNVPPAMAAPGIHQHPHQPLQPQSQQQHQHQPNQQHSRMTANDLGAAGYVGQQAPLPTAGISSPVSGSSTFVKPREMTAVGHDRRLSTQVDSPPTDGQSAGAITAPIARPAPIKRPASVKPGQSKRNGGGGAEVDELSKQLGSSALLDDSDEPIPSGVLDNRRASAAVGMPPVSSSSGFLGSPFDQAHSAFGVPANRAASGDSWGRAAFGAPGAASPQSLWGSTPNSAIPASAGGATGGVGGGWGASNAFQPAAPQMRPKDGRSETTRMLTVQTCRVLASQSNGVENSGFFDFNDVAKQTIVSSRQLFHGSSLSVDDIDRAIELPGELSNGGGVFYIHREQDRKLVKWVPTSSGDLPPPQMHQSQQQQPHYQHQQHQQHQHHLQQQEHLHLHHQQQQQQQQQQQHQQQQSRGFGHVGSPIAEVRLPNLSGLGRF